MSENAILTSRDKEILRGKRGPEHYADFENRKAKIRSRVRRRREVLAAEIELLVESGEERVVDEFCESVSQEISCLGDANIQRKIERIERDLNEIEDRMADIQVLRSELDQIREDLGQID